MRYLSSAGLETRTEPTGEVFVDKRWVTWTKALDSRIIEELKVPAREAAEARARAREAARAARARAPEAPPDRVQDAAARPTAPDPPTPRGARPMPAAGQVTREFGAGGEGGAARGMTLSALAGARVVSPCGGKVVFGSSFRSYGLLLIVDCGDGYHFVLAGLDRLDAAPGQRVRWTRLGQWFGVGERLRGRTPGRGDPATRLGHATARLRHTAVLRLGDPELGTHHLTAWRHLELDRFDRH